MSTQMQAQAEFQAHEMAEPNRTERAWMTFLTEVSRLTGIDNLDGDNSAAAKSAGVADGYSLDELHDWFETGRSARSAADQIAAAH